MFRQQLQVNLNCKNSFCKKIVTALRFEEVKKIINHKIDIVHLCTVAVHYTSSL